MKNFVTLSVLCALFGALFAPLQAYSQDSHTPKESPSFVSKTIKVQKFYSQKELEKLPKLDLINIYKERLAYLIEVLPFISLHPAPGATFHDMAIPETQDNIAHLDKEMENKEAFVSSLFETLDDVIPYSEKDHIIWSILYFDEMIKKSNYQK